MPQRLRLKKGEDRRIRSGHLWVFSNEIDTKLTPLKNLAPGVEALIEAHDGSILGVGYVNPHSLITARILSRQPQTQLDETFFIHALESALHIRERLFSKPFYRLVFSEADYLPGLVVDRFGDHLVAQINTAGMDVRTDIIVRALKSVLPTTETILLRNDSSVRKHEGLDLNAKAALGTPPERVCLEENGTQFFAPLWQGQKTGWFYDHRSNRARLHDYVAGQSVLDVFSYLGGWGIQAAMHQARSVTCIDASATAAAYIQENAALNHVADKINIICDDAFTALKNLQHSGAKFDVIVLDPPAFIKKQKDRQEGLVAYLRLNELALKLLNPDGILCACSCSMHLSYDDMIHLLQRASNKSQRPLQILERGHQAPDHPIHLSIPETDYLKMVLVRCLG